MKILELEVCRSARKNPKIRPCGGYPSVGSLARQRTRYSAYIKEQVRQRYKLCRTTADKEELAEELGIGSVSKLYNLASRLGAAGGEAEIRDPGDAQHSVIRETPGEVSWTRSADRYLRDEFGRRAIEDIAYHLGRSEPAVFYRARHLGLRTPVKHWRLDKVSDWFGWSPEEVRNLHSEGIDVYPLTNRRGEVVLEVVSTTSLARWLSKKKNQKRLRDPDQIFLLEIEESMQDLVDEKAVFEKCKFLSHGHVCQNPFTDNSYGLFCTNNEKYDAGDDPRCTVRTLAIEDLAPED